MSASSTSLAAHKYDEEEDIGYMATLLSFVWGNIHEVVVANFPLEGVYNLKYKNLPVAILHYYMKVQNHKLAKKNALALFDGVYNEAFPLFLPFTETCTI